MYYLSPYRTLQSGIIEIIVPDPLPGDAADAYNNDLKVLADAVGTIETTLQGLGSAATLNASDFDPAGAAAAIASSLTAAIANKLTASNNLSDVANAANARTNLGLGSIATHSASDFLPTAGGTLSGNLIVNSAITAHSFNSVTIDYQANVASGFVPTQIGFDNVSINFRQYQANAFGLTGTVSGINTSASNFVFDADGARPFYTVGDCHIGVPSTGSRNLYVTGKLSVGGNAAYGAVTLQGNVPSGNTSGLALYNSGGGTNTSISLDYYTTNNNGGIAGASIKALDDGDFSNHLLFLTKQLGGPSNHLVERMRLTSAGDLHLFNGLLADGGIKVGGHIENINGLTTSTGHGGWNGSITLPGGTILTVEHGLIIGVTGISGNTDAIGEI